MAAVRAFHSPLGRVVATCELACRDLVPLEERACLSELCHGTFEGRFTSELVDMGQDKRFLDKEKTPWPAGECYADVRKRISPFADELRAGLFAGSSVLVVAHQKINMILAQEVLRTNSITVQQPEGSVLCIGRDSWIRLVQP